MCICLFNVWLRYYLLFDNLHFFVIRLVHLFIIIINYCLFSLVFGLIWLQITICQLICINWFILIGRGISAGTLISPPPIVRLACWAKSIPKCLLPSLKLTFVSSRMKICLHCNRWLSHIYTYSGTSFSWFCLTHPFAHIFGNSLDLTFFSV